MYSIIVHGGAGNVPEEKYQRVRSGVREALSEGKRVLKEGGSSLDAVEQSINSLEDNEIFNAGTGSVLNIEKEVQMDACLMTSSLDIGGLASVKRIKNPISVSRDVMEKIDHVLLSGRGAEKFARALGHDEYDPVTEDRIEKWSKLKEEIDEGESQKYNKISKLIEKNPELILDTVGAVAIDDDGFITAGTSTGGLSMKMVGRVGDTPLVGSGTYANEYGGVSATGIGEGIIKLMVARKVNELIKKGKSAQEAAKKVVKKENNLEDGNGSFGVIVIDKEGNIGFEKNTENMSVAYCNEDMDEIKVSI